MDINKIIQKVKENDSKADIDLITSAYQFAKKAHQGQTRKTGEPYFEHCLHTAYNLAQIKAEDTTIAAGLLHDVPEDTSVPLKKIKQEFGEEVARLVKGITKLEKVRYRGEERYTRNLKRMFLAMAKDLRVILIKFADRLHNLETLDIHPQEKKERIAKEVLEVYVPIAWLLGIDDLRWQMEDWCFKYLQPEEYRKVRQKIEVEEGPRIKQHIQKTKEILNRELKKTDINYNIIDLYKHYYGFFKKSQLNDPEMKKLHNAFAIVVITESVSECYKVLGTIHSLWKPRNDLFKDYIAIPKTNGYRGIHTTIFGPDGNLTEFQIKTDQMHQEALYGISAYWHYQKQKGFLEKEPPKWIQEISEIQKNAIDNYEFVNKIKFNVLKDRILVFTPRGDLVRLVKNATPIDFAYAIHTDIGNKASKAIVNNKEVPLDTELKDGDSVKIITKESKKYPDAKWLKFTKSHRSQIKIKENLPPSKLNRIKRILKYN